jgi:hypothetical protein
MKPLIERITKGPAKVVPEGIDTPKGERIANTKVHKDFAEYWLPIPEQQANAEFIAEAFNVAHETGMTPRQMADELAHLKQTLKDNGAVIVKIPTMGDTLVTAGDPDALNHGPEDRRHVLPEGLPPLPPGTRYGGQLKDHEGRVKGWIYNTPDPEGWEGPETWGGMARHSEKPTADWHVAVPI